MSQIELYGQDFLTTEDMTLEALERLMLHAHLMRNRAEAHYKYGVSVGSHVQGRRGYCAFFEDSTRTFNKSMRALELLGCSVDGFRNPQGLATGKGEGLEDTIAMIASEYTDLLVIRHPAAGSAQIAADICDFPVVNGGDGTNQHPTQAGLDLQTMLEHYEAFRNPTAVDWSMLQGKTVAICGDLRNGRTLHSGIPLYRMLGMKLILCSAPELKLAKAPIGVEYEETDDLKAALSGCDIFYMTRIQFNRPGMEQYQHLRGRYVLTSELIRRINPDALIMHPLPRDKGDGHWTNCEIQPDVDALPNAVYLTLQAKCGIWLRMALFDLLIRPYQD